MLAGAVGRDQDVLGEAQIWRMPCARAAVRSCGVAGVAREGHSGVLSGAARPCTFMPCCLCLWLSYGSPAAIRPVGMRGPSTMSKPLLAQAHERFAQDGSPGSQHLKGLLGVKQIS